MFNDKNYVEKKKWFGIDINNEIWFLTKVNQNNLSLCRNVANIDVVDFTRVMSRRFDVLKYFYPVFG